MIEIMKIKTRIRTILICIFFGYGIAAAQNPKMEQVMNSKGNTLQRSPPLRVRETSIN